MKNTETGEEFEIVLSMAERESYLSENTHIIQQFKKFPGICDPVRIGVHKTDSNFRDVLHKAKSAHAGSTIET